MATARQIVALLNSHVQGEEEQFLSIALQVAAAEAGRGRQDVADELKRLVDTARDQRRVGSTLPRAEVTVPISRPRGELQNLLTAAYPRTRLDDVVLRSELAERLKRVVVQQRRRDALRAHGQTPNAKLLFVGPPGAGKTLTASALAGELRLPLFTLRLDSLITRFMGETAAKLRLVFDQVAQTRGVYLFDEFDAIGGRRTADNDVGEMRRVLNSFLQFLEEDNATDSLIVCATNHPELLDRALFRRFDEALEYGLPDDAAVQAVIEARLGRYKGRRLAWSKIVEGAHGLSPADLVRAADEVIKDAILDNRTAATTEGLLAALQERRALRESLVLLGDG
jgi:SpoVK/Ycf46/Vps4 family AAA+-type ATPase